MFPPELVSARRLVETCENPMNPRWLLAPLLLLGLALASPAAPSTSFDYCVNRNAQDDGDHEVHRGGCRYLPLPENRIDLGPCADCHAAVRAARKHYPRADGCYHCSRSCDTG